MKSFPPLHDRLCAPVAVESTELAAALHRGGHAVGEVLPAVGDEVPADAVLGGEGAGTGAEAGQGGQVGAQAQVQRQRGAVYPQVCTAIEKNTTSKCVSSRQNIYLLFLNVFY